MPSSPIELRAERGVADVVNATFAFLRQNVGALVRLLATTALPVALLGAAIATPGALRDLAEPTPQPLFDTRLTGVDLLVVLLSAAATITAVLAVYAYMQLYAARGAGRFTLAEVRGRMLACAGQAVVLTALVPFVLGAFALINIIPIAGTIAFVVGGTYLALVAALAYPVLVWESESATMAASRAVQLLRGEGWRTLGVLLLLGGIYFVLLMALTIPAIGVGMAIGWQQMEGAAMGPVLTVLTVLAHLFSAVGGTLVYAVPLVGIGLQYLSLVEEQEQVGLRARVAAMAETASPGPPSGTPEAAADAPRRTEKTGMLPAPGADDDDSRWAPSPRS